MNQLLESPVTVALHEIRSPLGLVSMLAHAAAEASDEEDVKAQCQTIARTAERLLRVTSTLFELSEQHVPEEAVFRPVDVIREQLRDVASLSIAIEGDFGRGTGERTWRGGRSQFEALVQSLLMNAAEHGKRGEPIHVTVRERSESLVVTVENRIAQQRRHRGLGLGHLIAEQLATVLGVRMSHSRSPEVYRVVMEIPTSANGTRRAHSRGLAHGRERLRV